MGQLYEEPNADAAVAVRSAVAALDAPARRGRGRPTVCTAARPPSHPHRLGEKESKTSTNFKPCLTPWDQNVKQILDQNRNENHKQSKMVAAKLQPGKTQRSSA